MSRNATLDYARFLASLGIVLFHAKAPGASIGYAALPFFMMTLILLSAPGMASQPFRLFAVNRARRLLGPWLLWSIVYGLLKLLDVAVSGHPLGSEFALWMLLTGPALHLWFLPFAFIACLAIYPVARRLMRSNPIAGLAIVCALALASQAFQSSQEFLTPFSQWFFVLPSAIFALAFATGQNAGSTATPIVLAMLAAGGLVICSTVFGWTTGLFQFGLATGVLGLCLLFPLQETALSRLAADVSLGIYLVHPLMISVLTRVTPLAPATMGLALAAMAGALMVVLVLRALKHWRKDATAFPGV